MTDQLTIGQAARQAGLSAKAVRLYERRGLLPPAQRTPAGYRLFTGDDVDTLTFIRQAKTLGLSLAEIGDILTLRRGGTAPCQHVLRLLDARIADIDRTIADLRRLRAGLTRTRRNAADVPAGCDDGGVCHIIEQSAPAPEAAPAPPVARPRGAPPAPTP